MMKTEIANFKGMFTPAQQEELEKRSNVHMDEKVSETYDQVISKAEFLMKMKVPQAFVEAKRQVKKDLKSQISGGIAAFF